MCVCAQVHVSRVVSSHACITLISPYILQHDAHEHRASPILHTSIPYSISRYEPQFSQAKPEVTEVRGVYHWMLAGVQESRECHVGDQTKGVLAGARGEVLEAMQR